jgi:hypothetical protein
MRTIAVLIVTVASALVVSSLAFADPAPFVMEGGGKVDEQDMYVQLTITAAGEWRARVNSKATSHAKGSCGKWRALLLDSGSNTIADLGHEQFCTGTKDGVGGQKERDDWLSGRLTKEQIAKIAKVQIDVAPGGKDTWDGVIRIAQDIKGLFK